MLLRVIPAKLLLLATLAEDLVLAQRILGLDAAFVVVAAVVVFVVAALVRLEGDLVIADVVTAMAVMTMTMMVVAMAMTAVPGLLVQLLASIVVAEDLVIPADQILVDTFGVLAIALLELLRAPLGLADTLEVDFEQLLEQFVKIQATISSIVVVAVVVVLVAEELGPPAAVAAVVVVSVVVVMAAHAAVVAVAVVVSRDVAAFDVDVDGCGEGDGC
jgi:hypothetical protein